MDNGGRILETTYPRDPLIQIRMSPAELSPQKPLELI